MKFVLALLTFMIVLSAQARLSLLQQQEMDVGIQVTEHQLREMITSDLMGLVKNEKFLVRIKLDVNTRALDRDYGLSNQAIAEVEGVNSLPGLPMDFTDKDRLGEVKHLSEDDIYPYVQNIAVEVQATTADQTTLDPLVKSIIRSNFNFKNLQGINVTVTRPEFLQKTKDLERNERMKELKEMLDYQRQADKAAKEEEKDPEEENKIKFAEINSYEQFIDWLKQASIMDLIVYGLILCMILGVVFIAFRLISNVKKGFNEVSSAIEAQETSFTLPEREAAQEQAAADAAGAAGGSQDESHNEIVLKLRNLMVQEAKLMSQLVSFVAEIKDYLSLAILMEVVPGDSRKKFMEKLTNFVGDEFKNFLLNNNKALSLENPFYKRRTMNLFEILRLNILNPETLINTYMKVLVEDFKMIDYEVLMDRMNKEDWLYLIEYTDPKVISYIMTKRNIKITSKEVDDFHRNRQSDIKGDRKHLRELTKIVCGYFYETRFNMDDFIASDPLEKIFPLLPESLIEDWKREGVKVDDKFNIFRNMSETEYNICAEYIKKLDVKQIAAFLSTIEVGAKDQIMSRFPDLMRNRIGTIEPQLTMDTLKTKQRLYKMILDHRAKNGDGGEQQSA